MAGVAAVAFNENIESWKPDKAFYDKYVLLPIIED
jgi:hypothetical protein